METCRTCAKCDFENETNWLDLFHPTRCVQEIEHIRAEFQTWQLMIAPNDGLPQKICTDCFSKFCNVTMFRRACQEAQLKLNNIFDRIETQIMNAVQNNELEVDESLEEKALQENREQVRTFEMEYEFEEQLDNEGIFQILDYYKVGVEQTLNATKKNKTISLLETTMLPLTTAIVDEIVLVANSPHQQQEKEKHLQQLHIIDEEPEGIPIQENSVDVSKMDHMEIVDNTMEDYVPIKTFETNETSNQYLPNQIAQQNTKEEEEEEEEEEEDNDLLIIFECRYCIKSLEKFRTQKALLAHITTVHPSATHPFTCPQCDEGFQDAASRTMHMKAVHVAKHYKCKWCNKQYADRFNLRHHVEKYHSETDFECKLCEKRFYSRKSLNYHAKWHNPERQLKCSFIDCERLFINQRHLKCHEETHTGLRKSEICTFCGKCK